MQRLTQSEAFAVIKNQASAVCNFAEMLMLSGPLQAIIGQLYGSIGRAGIYSVDEAVEIFIARAVANGYSDGMVRPKVTVIVKALYDRGYVAAIDSRGFFIGKE